ncbi:MAG: carboxysome peptide A [Gammaproteobacteria bacterium]|nr:carboxysome peptide A [Gammaproteobacteria bacterium]
MKICQVERPLVSTNRIAMMEHKHLQVVIDGSSKLVAVDAVGAKPGDWVICVGSSAAREAAGSKGYPSDLTIVGIIDHWPPPGSETDEAAAGGGADSGEGPAASSGADSAGGEPGADKAGGA